MSLATSVQQFEATAPGLDTRLDRVRVGMAEQDLDAIVVLKPQNSFYLSGFNPVFYSHPVVAILPREGSPILLVHALRDDHAHASSPVKDIRLYGAWSTKVTMGPDWAAALSDIVREVTRGNRRIGVDLDFIPTKTLKLLEGHLGGSELVDASDILTRARLVKDESEINALRVASGLTDAALEASMPIISARGTEREVATAAMSAMLEAWRDSGSDFEIVDFANTEGAVHSGLATYCLTGDRIGNNADGATNRKIADGELCMVFSFATCEGIHSEQERCFIVGDVDERVTHLYDTFLFARDAILNEIKPGTSLEHLYHSAAKIYEERGYSANMPGRMGHGIGLGPHEEPSIRLGETMALEPGMAITVEPNLRVPFLNGGGGQHSDTIVVTPDGYEMLTHFDRGVLRV